MKEESKRWYLYHKVGDRMVVDRAEHTDHHRQAHAKLGLPPPVYLAGTQTPLTDEEVKRFEAQYGCKLDTSHKSHLPEWEEPEHWKTWRRGHEQRKNKLKGAAK